MKIHINDLTFKCIIGILPFERKKKQTVIVDISFTYKFEKDNFIDYSKISKRVEKTMKKEQFFLIEDALTFLEKVIKRHHPVAKLKLKITKPNILKNCRVAVSKK